jgi:hypothetical protein
MDVNRLPVGTLAKAEREQDLMANLGKDIRHSLQILLKNPGFTIAAVAALALGIGANTAIFTVVNTVLLKPLTYPDSDRMVEFFHRSANGGSLLASNLASIPMFHIYQRQTSAFSEVAAYDFTSPGFNLTGNRPEQLRGIHVSEGYFRLFGAQPILGRTFTPRKTRRTAAERSCLAMASGNASSRAIRPS